MRLFRHALLAAVALGASHAAVANPFVHGQARFTVVTPECIRIEYSARGTFVDAPSMFAVNRSALDPTATSTQDGAAQVIKTGRLTLRYTPDGKPFSAANLSVELPGGGRWTPDSRQTRNLGGTINTLDQVKGPVSLEEGILSRDGWYLLDDSKGHLLVNDWVAPRAAEAGTDWYLFGYGADYPAAFRAFTTIGGVVPMPRKAVLGSWYSRWWEYTTKDYKDIVREYAENNFPLDIIVMDMEWHTGPWTGWSWNYALLDDPPALLKWFRKQGLAVTLNVHPADGVGPTETMYRDFMEDLGEDPDTTATIPFDAGNKRYMEAYFRHTHHPREAEGVDFWWLDWQQYPEVKSVPGLLNLSWLNKLYFENSMRTGKRGLQFSRWGAWGDHRHPIHFSGDADTGWAMLGFEVPFTSTAANEGAYFWSHDVGGHFGDRNEEPYTRWVQFAATTAAMRIHSGIIPYLDRRPWKWPAWATESMRESFHLRSRLMPYVYSSVRETHETGLPLNRPMYVEWPELEDAYLAPQQYLFGSDVLVAPIASRGYGEKRVASQLVWFPPGEWRNYFTHEAHTGPQWRVVSADMNESPMYVRAGVPIPEQPYSPRPTTAKLETLVVRVWPGPEGEARSFTLYEDDGLSREYEKGRFARTELTSLRQGNAVEVRIAPAQGRFDDQPGRRAYQVVLGGVEKPTRVTVDGKPVEATWDPKTETATVTVKRRSIRKATVVRVEAAAVPAEQIAQRQLNRRLDGILGASRGLRELGDVLTKGRFDPEVLPGLVALAGVAVVDNGTHYPFVGTMTRVVRNADSPIAADSISVVWERTVRRASGAKTETVENRVAPTQPVLLTKPTWPEAGQLAFLENASEARLLRFQVEGRPMEVRHPVSSTFGQLRTWSVSPAYPFDRAKEISAQQYEPELLPWEQLATPQPGWISVEAGPDGVVDLQKARGGDNRVAYASAVVEMAEPRKATLGFRSDDGVEVWLNGRKVHSMHVFRGLNHNWEEVPVEFQAGRNVLLVKVSQADFGWGFMVNGSTGTP